MSRKLIGKRVFIAAPVAAIIISFFFSCAFYPMVNMEAHDIPIAVVSADKGMKTPAGTVNAGQALLTKVKTAAAAADTIKLTFAKEEKAALADLKEGQYCALLVIPSDFTQKQLTAASSKPQAPVFQIYLNQGGSGMAATMAQQALTAMIEQAGNAMKPEVLKALRKAGVTLTDQQAAYYDAPLLTETTYINPIKSASPISMLGANSLGAILTWISALIMSIFVYFYYRKERTTRMGFAAAKITVQVAAGLISACIAALTIAFLLVKFIGFDVSFGMAFLYLLTAVFCISMMILGVLRWTRAGGAVLFVIVMFLCMPTVNLPFELLPSFWQDWIYPWAPARYVSEGLRDVFYMSGTWLNHETAVLLGMGSAGLILQYLSLLYKEKKRD